MALEAISSNEPFNFIIYDTISATSYSCQDSPAVAETSFLLENCATTTTPTMKEAGAQDQNQSGIVALESCTTLGTRSRSLTSVTQQQGRKKRKRKPRVCKNKEEAETQRMTHIAVERNRRKQMNEHLAILRSLMPESYAQRGDQASIVGGAIEFVKELEHLLLSLEAQKLQLLQSKVVNEDSSTTSNSKVVQPIITPFLQFSGYDISQGQSSWSQQQSPNKFTSKTKADIADIEVTLIETHANLRIVMRRITPRQLSKLVAGVQTLQLTILHLTVNTIYPFVLYSISVKIEEGCLLTSVDDIAAAFYHMIRVIEEEAAFC
ncbi:transcription factor bHLH71 [Rosa rugosa]|uniref:transcription factor bHLH71 n=1 Tax=Rosa rugosa TaxID=74645 RepID=UPI002B40F6C3|nr:transcription factor bHLH71 [Rosa rugosa]